MSFGVMPPPAPAKIETALDEAATGLEQSSQNFDNRILPKRTITRNDQDAQHLLSGEDLLRLKHAGEQHGNSLRDGLLGAAAGGFVPFATSVMSLQKSDAPITIQDLLQVCFFVTVALCGLVALFYTWRSGRPTVSSVCDEIEAREPVDYRE